MTRVNWREVKSPALTAEQVAVKLYDAAKGKASTRKLLFTLDFKDVLQRVKQGKCEVSGIPFDMRQKPYGGLDFPFRASLDRIDNTVGYVTGNIQVVSKIFNTAKWCWNDEDVFFLAQQLVDASLRKERGETKNEKHQRAIEEAQRVYMTIMKGA